VVTIIFIVAFIMGFRAPAVSARYHYLPDSLLFGLGICGPSMLVAVWTKRSEAVISWGQHLRHHADVHASGSFLPLALIGGWLANVAKVQPAGTMPLDAARGPTCAT